MLARPLVRLLAVAAVVTLVALVLAWALLREPPQEAAPPAGFDPSVYTGERPELDAPYVATGPEVVDAMLELADVGPGDYVVDLGSGDGRILIAAAREHGARGLGVDIDPARVRDSRFNARAAGVNDRVQFERRDLFRTPLAEADVLTLYLSSEINRQLRPRILSEMKPGARVVSHAFDMGEWEHDARSRVGTANVYMWIVPADVEGRWRLDAGGREARLRLDQSFQNLSGTITVGGRSRPIEHARVRGDLVEFVAEVGGERRVFLGRIEDGRITPASAGETAVSLPRAQGWSAVREGRP